MAKPTTVKEAIKKFEEAGGVNASEAEKVELPSILSLRDIPTVEVNSNLFFSNPTGCLRLCGIFG